MGKVTNIVRTEFLPAVRGRWGWSEEHSSGLLRLYHQNIKKMYSRKMKKGFDPLLSISFPQLGGAEIVLMGKPASCLYSTENILEGNQRSDPLLPSSTPLFSICSFRNCDLSIPYGWYQWCGPEVVVRKSSNWKHA